MNEILITGANGQLGTELRKLFDEKDILYNAPTSSELDITDSQIVEQYINHLKPEYIFHCAAYTAVDSAEDKGKELNWGVNAEGTENIARVSELVGATLVYISTDYVFDGESKEEYQVDSEVNPRNEYGRSKLAGEQAVQKYCSKYYTVRTSWVFGEYGENFIYTMLKLAETYKKITVVADQVGRPTWTKTIADFLYHIYQTNPEYGVYHLSNDDSCSWYEFATEILKDKDIEIQPVTSEQYPQKAYRPRHSVMSLDKTQATGFETPTWREALNLFLGDIK